MNQSWPAPYNVLQSQIIDQTLTTTLKYMATHNDLFLRNFVVCINLPTDIKRDLYVYYILFRLREEKKNTHSCHFVLGGRSSHQTTASYSHTYALPNVGNYCCCRFFTGRISVRACHFHTITKFPYSQIYSDRMIYIGNNITSLYQKSS